MHDHLVGHVEAVLCNQAGELRICQIAFGRCRHPRDVCPAGATATRLMPSKFCKVMVVAHHQDLGLGEHVAQEWLGRGLRGKLLACEHLDVHFASEDCLSRIKQVYCVGKADVRDQKQLDITGADFKSLGLRRERKRGAHLPRAGASASASRAMDELAEVGIDVNGIKSADDFAAALEPWLHALAETRADLLDKLQAK